MRDIRQETYYVMEEHELQQIIQGSLNRPDYQIAEGWPRNSFKMLFVELKDYDKYSIENVTDFLQKKSHYCNVLDLMLELAYREEIPEGIYLISTF